MTTVKSSCKLAHFTITTNNNILPGSQNRSDGTQDEDNSKDELEIEIEAESSFEDELDGDNIEDNPDEVFYKQIQVLDLPTQDEDSQVNEV